MGLGLKDSSINKKMLNKELEKSQKQTKKLQYIGKFLKEFEKKYNLKVNSIEDKKNDYLSFKSLKQKKQELINLLKTTKNNYLRSRNVVSDSYGFVTITAFIFALFITSITSFIVFYTLFRR